MKKNKLIILISILLVTVSSCSDFLDVEPKNKIPGDVLLTDPKGIDAFIGNLYYQAPIEDFVYFPSAGFNARGNTGSLSLSQYGLEAIHSEWANWNAFANDWWVKGYKLNRSINILNESLPTLDITSDMKEELEGEVSFLRAYAYFALAKRYGGVPIIEEVQEYDTDFEKLKVPRKTEKETWDFILAECDKAILKLPDNRGSNNKSCRRATKWAAYALKSRVALHAASLCKYWNKAPLSGIAVEQKLVGMDVADANQYYEACIKASVALIESGKFGLYQPNPANPTEAARNYQALFMDPNVAVDGVSEVIFLKGYANIGENLAHDLDGWNNPNQTSGNFPHRGRTNPILEFVDIYESYDNPGYSAPIVTTTDGIIHNDGYNPGLNYRTFDSPKDIFANKDARLFASIILPFSEWKNMTIIIQGGLVKPDGNSIEIGGEYTHNGVTYYTFGAQHTNQFSGFNGSADMTRSGFLMKKFLNENTTVNTWLQSTTDFMDMRYGEVLLNFAEAVVESGYTIGDAQQKAKDAINTIRRRAGHTVDIPLTLDNVLRERKVELAFENKEYWDLIRRRTFHTEFQSRYKKALMPMIDLRGVTPQYILVRKDITSIDAKTFMEKDYYRSIPGTGGNGVIQNPQH